MWAWRPRRVHKIKKLVDHLAVILPFEADFFSRHGIPVTFVGHPLLDSGSSSVDCQRTNIADGENIIGLLPGSRDREIARLLPIMMAAAENLSQRTGGIKFLVSVAPSVDREAVEQIIKSNVSAADVEIVDDGVMRIFQRSRLVVATSGTVTMEAAICGTPMIIIYKVSPLTYRLGKALAKVEYIGLVNLIAGKGVVPELLQQQASPGNIADKVIELLGDDTRLDDLKNELLKVKDALGGPGASKRVAQIALSMLY